MFGRQPRLPVDLAFGLPVKGKQQTSHSQYVHDLKTHLEESYKIATANAEKVMQRNKSRFDKHVKASDLSVGDRVLVRNVRLRGKHKLADKWEPDVYIVVKRAGTLPVYTVRPENKDQPSRTLHRDLLLPCGYLPASDGSLPKKQPLRPKPLPDSDNPADADNPSDEDEIIPSHWYNGSPNPDLSRFTKIIDIPIPTETTQSTPSAGKGDGPLNLPNLPDSYLPDVTENPESAYLPDTMDSPERNLPDNPDSPENVHLPGNREQSSELADDIPQPPNSPITLDTSDSDSSDDLPVVRRSTRDRRPPDRLCYSKPGKPVLKAVQSLFHGISAAFTYALAGPGVPNYTMSK